jgi:hypothetical protein
MAHNAEYDEADFLDDDLDHLPPNTLQALEQSAFLSTQRQRGTTVRPKQGSSAQVDRQVDFANENPRSLGRQESHTTASFQGPDSDYGFDGEDVINLDETNTILETFAEGQDESYRSKTLSAHEPNHHGTEGAGRSYPRAHRTNASQENHSVSVLAVHDAGHDGFDEMRSRIAEV